MESRFTVAAFTALSLLASACGNDGTEASEPQVETVTAAAQNEPAAAMIDPLALFPEPEEFGAGWVFTDGDGPFSVGGSEDDGTFPEPGLATRDEIDEATCNEGEDFVIGSPPIEEEVSADYTGPSGDRIWIRAFFASDASIHYLVATEDSLGRCSDIVNRLPDPALEGAVSTRAYQADPVTGNPKIEFVINSKLIEVFQFPYDPESPADIDLLAIAQLLADRAA